MFNRQTWYRGRDDGHVDQAPLAEQPLEEQAYCERYVI